MDGVTEIGPLRSPDTHISNEAVTSIFTLSNFNFPISSLGRFPKTVVITLLSKKTVISLGSGWKRVHGTQIDTSLG